MARKKDRGPVPIEAVKHKAKRTNIPTEELREFVAGDESKPKSVTFDGLLYARDPSLDPQLVWKGKDEQDRQTLEVPAVPVYIQEKIQPRAIIENLRAQARKEAPGQIEMFADFNGIAFEELVDFYHHEQNWSNRMILGDSLLVMTSLAEKEGLKGKVQTIYMDPPYGIKFGSNWQVSTRKRDVKDGKAEDVTRQPEQIRAFRDTWALGIHSYLTYLRDRLVVCRELLAETGSIFVQIGDENVHLVRCLMDEVFGAEGFCGLIAFRTTGGQSGALISSSTDFLLWFARDREAAKRKFHTPRLAKPSGRAGSGQYTLVEPPDSSLEPRQMTDEELDDPERIPANWRLLTHDTLFSQGASSDPGDRLYPWRGEQFPRPENNHWKVPPRSGMKRLDRADRFMVVGQTLRYKRYFEDYPVIELDNVWNDTAISGFGRKKQYVVETNVKVIERCLLMTTDPGDLVLDPTCGSGTTAYVAEHWGRRWITIDTSRVALALARTRLMAAKFPYYLLADSPEGARKEAAVTGYAPARVKTDGDVRKGFVLRRVPHIQLSTVANDEEIDTIHEKQQPQLDALLAKLNTTVGKKPKNMLREWEVPREPPDGWPAETKALLDEWWRLRRDRQKEIDDSIARHADTELLVDQPYEDAKRIRVTGPLTVESLSPHRVLAADEERPAAEREAKKEVGAGQFELMILDNLKKAGVQNTRKEERLSFTRLEPHAGVWIHAVGEYADATATARRVAVSIGPEHGTVGGDQVKEAAKEALHGVGFDLLIVCGFAFDAHAGETAKEFAPGEAARVSEVREWGKLQILLARMNPDLAMGDELLKKTGAGNLFMVFGEPDVSIETTADGRLVAEVKGVDVYDPTTGAIRSASTDDIACWFLDTAYNEESFFVRHAYFAGAEEPYERLKRALRAEVNEAAWSALYSTKSMPFDRPATGKIAIKVINHYGDEVLKVFDV